MKRLATLALAALLAACQQQPTVTATPDSDGLVAVSQTGADAVRIAPGTDLKRYRQLQIDGLHFSDVELVDPNTTHDPRHKSLSLSDADKQQLSELFSTQMTRQLQEDGRFAVATQGGADTLRVTTELVRLAPNAPRESDERFFSSVRDQTYTRGAGSMTLESQFYDSVSGERVAVIRNKLTDTEIWGRNNVVTNTAAVQRAFRRWAMLLQNQLRQLPTN